MTHAFTMFYSRICKTLNNLSICGNLTSFVHAFPDDGALVILTDMKKLTKSDIEALDNLMLELAGELNTNRHYFETSKSNMLCRVQKDGYCITLDYEGAKNI